VTEPTFNGRVAARRTSPSWFPTTPRHRQRRWDLLRERHDEVAVEGLGDAGEGVEAVAGAAAFFEPRDDGLGGAHPLREGALTTFSRRIRNVKRRRAMELRQLAYFVAVAEEGSFTRAAQRMHVAQPGISQQIRRLERDLGEQLFDRTNQSVRLTTAGVAFLPHARAALGATEAGRTALADLRGLVHGELRLGTIPGIPDIDLVGLLARFHDDYPGVTATLREDHPNGLIDDLRRDEYDAIIVGLSEPVAPDGLSIDLLSVEPLVLVTSGDHALGSRKRVAMSDLGGDTFITLPRQSALRGHLEDACRAAGFHAKVGLETSDVRLLGALVARGLGITIVPRSVAIDAARHYPLRIIEIRPPITQRCTALAWSAVASHSAALKAFLGTCRDALSASRATSTRRR
jgi:DNA-binding transcriptional LysR family regulator